MRAFSFPFCFWQEIYYTSYTSRQLRAPVDAITMEKANKSDKRGAGYTPMYVLIDVLGRALIYDCFEDMVFADVLS